MKWYEYNIANLTEAEYKKWYSLMSSEKQKRVDRARGDTNKKQIIAGEMLARKAIAEWCGVSPESIAFMLGEHGKPYIKDLDVEFNISHSGDMVVCAVNDSPIGIDVEQILPLDLKIAKRICTEEELFYLFGHTPVKDDFCYTENIEILTRFYELWTAKEAYGKLVGNGLASISIPSQNKTEKIMVDNEYMVSIIY